MNITRTGKKQSVIGRRAPNQRLTSAILDNYRVIGSPSDVNKLDRAVAPRRYAYDVSG